MAPVLDPTFRGGDGNVGIIRSPVRAIALPDCRQTVDVTCAVIVDRRARIQGFLESRRSVAGEEPAFARKKLNL